MRASAAAVAAALTSKFPTTPGLILVVGWAAAGNLWTCFAHIITAVIGCGVLALSWSVAQLGWVGGPVAMLCFAFVTYLSAFLLSHCYRSPASDDGSLKRQRNYTYMDAVRTHLGTRCSCILVLVPILSIG